MFRYYFLPLLCLIWACSSSSSSQESLQSFIQDYEMENQALEDLRKTSWPDYSEAGVRARTAYLASQLDRLAKLDRAEFSGQDKINAELLELILADEAAQYQYQAYLMPLNSEGGFLTEILYNVQGTSLDNDEEARDYLQKIQALPAYLEQQERLMRHGLEIGISQPALLIDRCLSLLEGNLKDEAFFETFLQPFDSDQFAPQRETVAQYVNESIRPAYAGFRSFLQDEYLPKTRSSIGISEIPEGRPYYEQRVRYFSTLEINPDSVFAIGESEVARIRQEMDSIISSLAWKGDFSSFLDFLRKDEQFYPRTPAALLERASWLSKKAEGFLPHYFGQLPRMPFTVEPVPASIAPNYTGGRYTDGSYEDHKPGLYWVNTYRLETRPFYVLPALTLHEAVPGHHTQVMLALEIEGVPEFRRRQYLSAFGEGWALYAEYLGKEAGMYETPYEHFGALTYEMWRACRLVVDVGMHYKGWSRQRAVDFMAANTALSLHEVNTEIDRYIGWPGQALSYKMGELTIRQLRREAEERLGDQFDIRAFHDLILEDGSVTMKILRGKVAGWVEDLQPSE